jgi:predicted ABC-type ATPase
MSEHRPHLVILAGPNGSGKTTVAPKLLRGKLAVGEFVNADLIASGLSVFDPDLAAMAAGRVMLARLKELATHRADFAFETTLASRSFVPWVSELKDVGYRFHLVFLWLNSPDLAVARVADRVRMGGHSVPEATIRRRYGAGLKNFFSLYCPLATTWEMVDNSNGSVIPLIASGRGGVTETVADPQVWDQIREEYAHGN